MHAQVKRGFSAMARSDMDVNVLVYEPDTVVWMHGMLGVGVGDCFRGREGVRALYGEIDDAFERWSWTIHRLVDGGDRLGVKGDFVGYGRSSGAKTELRSGRNADGALLARQDRPPGVVRRAERLAAGPRIHGAVGVGDVAGELMAPGGVTRDG
jgi:ketosteroid isomerase-like protein